MGGKQEGGLHLRGAVGSSESFITGESYHMNTHKHTSSPHFPGLRLATVEVSQLKIASVEFLIDRKRCNPISSFPSFIYDAQLKPKEQRKDTVCPREECPSSEKLSHDASHRPNVHCFIPRKKKQDTRYTFIHETSRFNCECTRHVVVHPVEHDLWSTVPPRGHITRHFIVCVPCQTEIQDLHNK